MNIKKITHVTVLSLLAFAILMTEPIRANTDKAMVAPSKQVKKAPRKQTPKQSKKQPKAAPVAQPSSYAKATADRQENKPLSKKEQRKQRREQKKAKEKALREKHKKPEKKLMRDMSYEELKEAKNRQLQARDTSSAIRYLEKMLPMSGEAQERRTNILELADLYFDNGELEKAGKLYNDFTQLYSGNNKVEYASYKSVLCSFYGTLSSDRDQTRTADTVERGEKFLERSSVFTTYTPEVQKIVTNCRKKLFDNQIGIFTFYFNRGRYTSAQKRLENIRKEFIPALPEAEPQILVLEVDLATKLNKTDVITQKQAELATKFPTHHQELVVAQTKNTRRFINRF